MLETNAGQPPSIPEPEVDPPCRRFTLFDMMVLIVAISICLLYVRPVFDLLDTSWRELHRDGLTPLSRPDIWKAWVFTIVDPLYQCVYILTLMFVVLRLRRPRPPLHRLTWQPGLMASPLISVSFIPRCVETNVWTLLVLPSSVALAWLVAWWAGHLRPEPGWIDGLGRFLGACWIALNWCCFLLMKSV